jgi:hypothetical protein
MSPTDFVLLAISVTAGTFCVITRGWTMNGIGPATLLIAGGLWQLWMQWLRHRSWLQSRGRKSAPATQHLAISAALGWLLGIAGALVWILIARTGR